MAGADTGKGKSSGGGRNVNNDDDRDDDDQLQLQPSRPALFGVSTRTGSSGVKYTRANTSDDNIGFDDERIDVDFSERIAPSSSCGHTINYVCRETLVGLLTLFSVSSLFPAGGQAFAAGGPGPCRIDLADGRH